MTGDALTYALVTPARDERGFIERTLRAVVAQTNRPARWVIVSDGSTDGTDAIVREYARGHGWIELVSIDRPEGRRFAGKARAFNAALRRLNGAGVDLIGNLDADVSLDADVFAYLLDRFRESPALGVAGVATIESGTMLYDYRFTNVSHVSGTLQLFRRACLEALGGYLPVEGGSDAIAVTTARMLGWQTRTFLEKACIHHRRMGSAAHGPWAAWFRCGQRDYALGNSVAWQVARSLYQMTLPPVVARGALIAAGYASASAGRRTRVMPDAVRRFVRTEHRRRVTQALARMNPLGARSRPRRETAEVSLGESLFRLANWVEAHGYRGYEPFDGLSSFVRPLTLGIPLLERGLQQLGRRSPINLRPVLGIRPLESTKGRGFMARGYLARWRETGGEDARAGAVACLDWLIRHKSPLHDDHSWGNHFDFTSRAGRYRKHESIIVWTSLIGQAFLDAFEDLGDERYLAVARSVCEWILKLPREATPAGDCLSYLAGRQLSIHNANLLGAAMLARTAKHTGRADLLDVARSAMAYSCAAQRPDGAWLYGEAPTFHWIDSFHTGYNLDSLQCYLDGTGDPTFAPHLDRGFHYFRTSFFEADGAPRYFPDRRYPIDIQCAAQAIETFSRFSDRDPSALADAERVARWTIRHMQDPAGCFYYRKTRRVTSRIPMLHWGQATMYRALAVLSLLRSNRARGAGARRT
jgi:glycosyltransferase involved in cell wall biosynthesis